MNKMTDKMTDKMYNRKIVFAESEAYPQAKQRFIETCGFDLSMEQHRRMMQAALAVRAQAAGRICLQAQVSFYEKEVFRDGKIVIGDTEFNCGCFAQLPKTCVEGVYFYILTAGEWLFSEQTGIMDSLYADIWGTGYLDAGSVLTGEKIKENLAVCFPGKNLYLSERLGPGYFGMAVSETKKFFQILDGEAIGVRLNESGMMIPQKSCAGFYLVYNRPDLKAGTACACCCGNETGCRFCSIADDIHAGIAGDIHAGVDGDACAGADVRADDGVRAGADVRAGEDPGSDDPCGNICAGAGGLWKNREEEL